MSQQGPKRAGAKQYRLCAWNRKIDGSGGCTTIEGLTDDGPLRRCIELYLSSLEWTRTDLDEEADLVVVLPRGGDSAFSLQDLLVFHRGLPGSGVKKVLYVHIQARAAFLEGLINDWLFVVRSTACPVGDLQDWLSKPGPESAVSQFALEEVREELRYHAIPERKMNEVGISRTGRCLLTDRNHSGFFFGLCRMAAGYDALEHHLNAKIRDTNAAGGSASADTTDYQGIKRFLDDCLDLRSAIQARPSLPVEVDATPVVLLVDDRPEKVQDEIARKLKQHLGAELWVWNPDEDAGSDAECKTRLDIERYDSLSGDPEGWTEAKISVYTADADGQEPPVFRPDPKTIIDVLRTVHCVLVDVLFQDATGREEAAGYRIIRGLTRLAHDLSGEILRNKKDWRAPPLVVISRASDQAKAHSAFRHGASGYVLKDRLLSLPGVVASAAPRPAGASELSHRSFRSLYNVSNEAIALLRSTRIPGLDFRKGGAVADRDATFATVSKLVATLPKADLHVHPGSCMSPEFLVVASLVMLLRRGKQTDLAALDNTMSILLPFWNGDGTLVLAKYLSVEHSADAERTFWSSGELQPDLTKKGSATQVEATARFVREYLLEQLEVGEENRRDGPCSREDIEARYTNLRSVLHRALKIRDHASHTDVKKRLQLIQDTEMFLFALSHSGLGGDSPLLSRQDVVGQKDDILRLFILWLMSRDAGTSVEFRLDASSRPKAKLHDWFRRGSIDRHAWKQLHSAFYGDGRDEGRQVGASHLRSRNWKLELEPGARDRVPVVHWQWPGQTHDDGLLGACPSERQHPLAWLLASGTRSTNLREYLEGCEYSGAEHLRHPFLMHLFAQQTLHNFVRHGVLYAELRAAISGYENRDIDFTFADACACFTTAFEQAQEMVRDAHRKPSEKPNHWLWGIPYSIAELFDPLDSDLARWRFPCKVSVILTGKRHKPSRMLIREAGAAAILFSRPSRSATNAREFVGSSLSECRIVGFDLAGQEDEHSPLLFREEYDRIAKMHIPVTVHAGENAPSEFVESAMLDLKARRLGHGLALADDPQLMDRARDEGICVELCPISNFQTNAVYPPNGDASGYGRQYPLRAFLEAGLAVTINTDNPIISYTNMVKECFQASFAFGRSREGDAVGLSLWELLRILRMGFVQSFLTLQERRLLLELADQIVFDLFSDQQVIQLLQWLTVTPGVGLRRT